MGALEKRWSLFLGLFFSHKCHVPHHHGCWIIRLCWQLPVRELRQLIMVIPTNASIDLHGENSILPALCPYLPRQSLLASCGLVEDEASGSHGSFLTGHAKPPAGPFT